MTQAAATLRDVLPSLQGKAWFIARADDVAAIDRGFEALARVDWNGSADRLTDLTPRDPRGIGVRGGYPQVNLGLPGQQAGLLAFVRYAYERSAPARILVDKVASDVWGEWVNWQTKDESLQKALEAFCKNPTGRPGGRPIWWWIERAYRLARRDGRSLLHFGLEDTNAATPSMEPGSVRGLRSLAVIRQHQIVKPILGTNPKIPADFGRILAWRVRLNLDGALGKAGTEVDIHADRVVPFIPYPDEDDEHNGKSVLAQNINYVEMIENLVWANAEAYFTEASPYIVVSLDKDVKLTEPQRTEAKATVANMQQAGTQRIFLQGVTVTVLSGSGQLANPLPHFEVAMKMFAMALGGLPTNVLTGDQAGELASAKEDSRRYAGMNSKVQEQDADPSLRAVVARLIKWDVKRWAQREPDPVDFTWNPIYEEAAGDEATRQEALMRTRTGYRKANLPLPVDLAWEPAEEWPEGTGPLPASSPFGFGQGQEGLAAGDSQRSAKGAPSALDRAVARFRRRVHDALLPAFKRAAKRADPGRGDAFNEVTVAAELDSEEARRALADAIEQGFQDAQVLGGEAAAGRMGVEAYYRFTSPGPYKSLARDLSDSVVARLTEEVRGIVASELVKGSSPRQIGDAIMARASATRVDAERIARSESIRAFNRGALESMQQNGVARYQWTAFSDADNGEVDGICQRFDGQVFDVGRGPVPVDDTHANCRCALLPVI